MQTEIIVALVGVVGIILGAVVTQLLARRKIDAEIEKIRAETERARAESDKLRAEIVQLAAPTKNEIGDKKDKSWKIIFGCLIYHQNLMLQNLLNIKSTHLQLKCYQSLINCLNTK